MPTSNPARIRSIYRALLRELPPRPILSSPRSPLHQRLRDTFQSPSETSSSPTSPSPAAHQQQYEQHHAEQLVAYLRAQRTYTTLLERYNPTMGIDEAERVRLSARRVGVNLPREYGSGGEGEGESGK